MIIDMRCRPPLPEFRQYFDISRIEAQGRRTGARAVSPAFVAGSMDGFVAEMDEAGIALAVVQGRNSPELFMGVRFNASYIANERIAQLQVDYPGRFVGLGGIDPSNRVHDALAETCRCLDDLGLKGIFLEPGRTLACLPDDPRLYPLYEACLERQAVVSLMTGPYAGSDIAYSDPVAVDRLATRYPELRIVCGHGCYPYVHPIIGVAYKHPNVFVSPDMYMFAPGAAPYVEAANTALRKQMVFGSAYPLRPMAQTVQETPGLGFAADALADYFAGNAARVLGLADTHER